MTTSLTETAVMHACQTLFGADVAVCKAFLFYIQPSGARSAYRRKAKETHPDIVAGADPVLQKQQALLFIEILKAYDVMNAFFKQRDEGLWREVEQAAAKRKYGSATKNEAAAKRGGARRSAETMYRGPLPLRPLEIGRYLYYCKQISYQELIDALVWQRNQRPAIGDIAKRWGWLSNGSIEKILQASQLPGRFGEKAVHLGLLSLFQVKTLLFYQRSQQERLGRYFVLNKLIAQDDLELLVTEMQEHNARVVARFMSAGNQDRRAHA